MKSKSFLVALAACLPLAAVAAPQKPGPAAGPGAEGWEARSARMMKRARVAFAVGYAEALDLSEAEALKARDVVAKFDERRAAIHKQMREQKEVVRKAAQGDAAAGKALDGAFQKLHELRGQMMAMHDEMFQALTQGLSPERKAKAALFFHHFKKRMNAHLMQLREQSRGMRGRMGPGDGGGPPGRGPRWGMGPGGGMGGDEADLEILPDSGPM